MADHVGESAGSTIEVLSSYIASALRRTPPEAVVEKASLHLIDTLGAIVSGALLPPGIAGKRVVGAAPAGDAATVVASGGKSDAARAAMANAMAAHADETDDSHEPSLTHPGCAVVPAALAVAERDGCSVRELLVAIALGYDVATRITRALWSDNEVLRTQGHSTHAIGGLFGAAAASAALTGLDPTQVRYLLSLTAQEASGMRTWTRDTAHVEKAYVFGGMPASTGVWVSTLAAADWPAVEDVFTGTPNFFEIFGRDPDPGALAAGLGEQYEIISTNIKQYAVGSPIQAPVDGLLRIINRHGLTADQVASATVRLPASLARVVDDREMPNINLQYLTSVALRTGTLTFADAHDEEGFAAWRTSPAGPPVEVIRDTTMEPVRQAHVTIALSDGQEFSEHVTAVRGTAANPMTRAEVERKVKDLIEPVLGSAATDRLLTMSRDPRGEMCAELVALLTPAG